MMSNKKTVFLVFGLFIVAFIGITIFGLIFRYKLLHTNNLSKTQVVAKLKITDGKISKDNGLYVYSVNVDNPTKKPIYVESFKFVFYDKNNKKAATLFATVDSEIKPNHSLLVMAHTDYDLKNANRVEIKINK